MSRLPRLLAGTGAAAAALVLAAPTAALADPPGDNGTIKINPYGATPGHADDPHPGCDFRLQLFDFDKGQTGTITFVGQAPTKGAVTAQPLSGTQLLSDDAASGGKDVDAAFDVTGASLGLTGTPAKQGWHIKVLVDPDDAPGGAKSKVFWLSCPAPAGSTSSGTQSSGTQSSATQSSGTAGETATGTGSGAAGPSESEAASSGDTSVTTQGLDSAAAFAPTGSAGTAAPATTGSAGVIGLSNGGAVTALGSGPAALAGGTGTARATVGTAGAAATTGGALPFTGLAVGSLVALALGSLSIGALAVRAGRRRSATS